MMARELREVESASADQYRAAMEVRRRIAAFKMLPASASLPHLKCSRRRSGADDEERKYLDTRGTGGGRRQAISDGRPAAYQVDHGSDIEQLPPSRCR